jgi:D-glycero-beta-D-manno-heptose 1-phosphate adenylyltransferase
MKRGDLIQKKIVTIEELKKKIACWKNLNKTFSFTNGCFDILHQGHIYSLTMAASEADYLVVAINSDDSVKRQGKGSNRPINDEQSRALLMASLLMVDAVVIFEEDTPKQLIEEVLPDVLVKGGDYTVDQIAGSNAVTENGGRVVINKIVEGFSTTNIINKINQNSKDKF